MNVIWVLIGGGLGAVTRYATTVLAARWWGTAFPWGTLLVNLAGCLAIGLLLGAGERAGVLSGAARLFWMVGFLGGLTTFSTYGLETMQAARSGDTAVLILNMVAHNAGGLLMVALGLLVARILFIRA